MQERRRFVRALPLPDHPMSVRVKGPGDSPWAVVVIDVSVGGLGVSPATGFTRGDVVDLTIDLPRADPLELKAEVRYVDANRAPTHVGLQFVDPPGDATRLIGRYVGELLERGGALRPG